MDPFAVKLTTKKRQGRIRFQLGVRSVGTLFVNWGDGHIDTLNFEPDEEIEIPSSSSLIKPEHYYTTLGFHEITITGDVYRILSFDNKGADLSAVDVSDAKSLISLSLNDLSLQQLNLSGLGVSYLYFTDIEIGNFNITGCDDVRELELSGNVSPATSDQIIQKLHSVTTTYNVTNGLVETHGLNPTLSTTASALVQDLQTTYDWTYWLYP